MHCLGHRYFQREFRSTRNHKKLITRNIHAYQKKFTIPIQRTTETSRVVMVAEMGLTGICVLLVVLSSLTNIAESQCDFNNDTVPEICREQSENNVSCTELNGECLHCTFPDNCTYGDNVTVKCVSKYSEIQCNDGEVCSVIRSTNTVINKMLVNPYD